MEIIKEIEFTTPVPLMTGEDVQQIITDDTLKEMVTYMSERHIPYLHARQVGIEMNFFVWQYKDKWKLVVNPHFIVKAKKKAIKNTVELSYSYRTDKDTPKLFQTRRAYECLAIFEEFKNANKKKRKSIKLKGSLSAIYQQLADISEGKNLTRF